MHARVVCTYAVCHNTTSPWRPFSISRVALVTDADDARTQGREKGCVVIGPPRRAMYTFAGRLTRPRAPAPNRALEFWRAVSEGRLAAEPRASASVIVLSAANEVLLLHRVPTSTSFPLAHVFPGGNLDPAQDGDVPPAGSPDRHRDGPAYRLAAIRECFEETGILLAKRDGALIDLPRLERDDARRRIHTNQMRFTDWLNSLGGVPDTGSCSPPPSAREPAAHLPWALTDDRCSLGPCLQTASCLLPAGSPRWCCLSDTRRRCTSICSRPRPRTTTRHQKR